MSQRDLLSWVPPPGIKARFDGPAYSPAEDDARLTDQLRRIKWLMADQHWRTLREIAEETGAPQASVSAQLRHLRKPRFGSHIVEKRSRGERELGLFEYRVLPSELRNCQAERDQLLKQIEKANRALRRAVARLEKLEGQ